MEEQRLGDVSWGQLYLAVLKLYHGLEPKYYVEVKVADRPLKVNKDALEVVKGVVKGKMLTRMKKEYVDCPLEGGPVAFLSCFVCVSHIRRVKGVVHCAGTERRTRE